MLIWKDYRQNFTHVKCSFHKLTSIASNCSEDIERNFRGQLREMKSCCKGYFPTTFSYGVDHIYLVHQTVSVWQHKIYCHNLFLMLFYLPFHLHSQLKTHLRWSKYPMLQSALSGLKQGIKEIENACGQWILHQGKTSLALNFCNTNIHNMNIQTKIQTRIQIVLIC